LHSTAHRSGVVGGACDALFTPRPLAPIYDIARQTQGTLLAALSAGATRDGIFSAALEELERPDATLIVFEDMHWAEEATLDLLKFLGRRIHRTKTLISVTYRDDEVTSRSESGLRAKISNSRSPAMRSACGAFICSVFRFRSDQLTVFPGAGIAGKLLPSEIPSKTFARGPEVKIAA
jgi:hypothetical protein